MAKSRVKRVKEDPRIPDSFRKGKRPVVETVGELIAELQLLPNELAVLGDYGQGVSLNVTNYNDMMLAVQIDKSPEDRDEDDFEDDE